MAYEHKPGTFSLFKNDKGGNDKRPDYRGDGKDMQGKDIEVAAWLREGTKGKYMSCSFKAKASSPQPQRQQPARDGGASDMDDDLPF
jgi:hypothetical protein